VDDVLEQSGDVSGKVMMTCSLPMNDDDTALVVGHTSSGAEELAKKASGARVVSAFGTVPSEVLFDVFAARGRGAPPSMAYCGDDADAKERVARLIGDVGFDPVDVGALDTARHLEPFTMLMAKLAYESDGGPEVAYRFERFAKDAQSDERGT
jgi:predicted dinucleotide-binding enzyme